MNENRQNLFENNEALQNSFQAQNPTSSQEVSASYIDETAFPDATYNDRTEGTEVLETQHLQETPIWSPPPEPEKPPRRKRGVEMVKWISVCLVFTIIGSSIGVFAAGTVLNLNTSTDSGTEQMVKQGEPDSSLIPTANTPAVNGEEMSASEIYALACQQVVGISTEVATTTNYGQVYSSTESGTGFFITEDGYIATNYHVVSTAVSNNLPITVILYNGDTYTAEYIGGDSDNDIALLKIDATGMNAVTFADSNSMQVGETVYAIGNALGELDYTLTSGLVSAMDREITSTSDNGSIQTLNMFQIDAAVNSGNSGGPVYNSRGEVLGIVTAKYSSTGVEGLGFALPSNDVVSMLNDLKTFGYVSGKPYIGIEVRTVDSSVAMMYDMAEGAYVASVVEGGAADTAGLQVGDIITQLDDTQISSTSDLYNALKKYSAGDTATIIIYRNGETVELSITFDEKVQTSSNDEESSENPGNEDMYEEYGIWPNNSPRSGSRNWG